MTGWATSGSTARTASQKILEFRYVKNQLGSGGSNMDYFGEITSATFEAGQWVYLDAASGYIQEAAAATEGVLGVAMKDATGVIGAKIPVYLGLPGQLFLGTADNAAQALQATVGDEVDLIVTGGVHLVDLDATSTDVFVVMGLIDGSTDSTHVNYGKVLVSVRDSQLGQDAVAAV